MERSMTVAVKGIAVRGGKMLIVQRAADEPISGGMWESVGGKLEFGEELIGALEREFREEVGLNAKVGKLLYASTFMADESRQVIILAYACAVEDGAVRLSGEHQAYQWASVRQARELLLEDILRDMDKNRVFEVLGVQ